MNLRILVALSIACLSALSLNAFTIENKLDKRIDLAERNQQGLLGRLKRISPSEKAHFDFYENAKGVNVLEVEVNYFDFTYNNDLYKIVIHEQGGVFDIELSKEFLVGEKRIPQFKTVFGFPEEKNITGVQLVLAPGKTDGSITIKLIE